MAKAKPKKPLLAKPGDPLVTSDGTALMPHGNPVSDEPVLTKMTARTFKATKRRAIRDLPAPVPVLNGVGAVFLYSIFGVGDREICDALKITMSQLYEVKNHPAYSEFFDTVLSEFINTNSGLLQARLAAYADGAINTLGTLAKDGKTEGTRLKASDSVLDRVGVTSKAQQEKTNTMGNELRIVIVDGNHRGVELQLNGEVMDHG